MGVSIFSPQFRDDYADHFKLDEGWRVRSGTGEYDERIVSAIRRNNLYYSMSQVPNYNMAGYIEQMPNVSEETRAELRRGFLDAPAAAALSA